MEVKKVEIKKNYVSMSFIPKGYDDIVLAEIIFGNIIAEQYGEELSGQQRRDGSIHKRHDELVGFGNYVNRVTIDGKDYYVRFTIQRKKAESGLHSSFVSNVDLYENPVTVAPDPSSIGRRMLDYDRISDAKLGKYFELSKKNEENLSNQIKFSLDGEIGAANADNEEETSVRMDNLDVAKQMEKEAKDSKSIKIATGWERGADGKWRYEEEDIKLSNEAYKKILKLGEDESITLGDLLGEDGNVLFKYYPNARSLKVTVQNENEGDGVVGSFGGNTINFDKKSIGLYRDKKHVLKTFVHEIQHYIQRIEGFSNGSNPSDFLLDATPRQLNLGYEMRNFADRLISDGKYKKLGNALNFIANRWSSHVSGDDIEIAKELARNYEAEYLNKMSLSERHANDLYNKNAGEVEARNVSKCLGMSDGRRRSTLSADTEDIPRDKQWVNKNDIRFSLDEDGLAPNGKDSKLSPKQWVEVRTKAFENWFGDWEKDPEHASKVVDKNGEPMVVYHQTGNDFTVFDPKHKGAGINDYQVPFGIFMKPSAKSIGVGGDKQMALYANIRKPLRVANRQELSTLLKSRVKGYKETLAEYEKIDKEYSKKFDEAMKYDHDIDVENWNKWKAGEITEEEYQNAISDTAKDVVNQWKEAQSKSIAKMKELVDNYFKGSEYDGIWIAKDEGSLGRSTETIIAFEPNQVKSAGIEYDDNGNLIPLSERFSENDDIRFSLDDEEKLQKAEANAKKPSKVEKQLRDYVVNLLRSMGIEVSTDAKEGQKVLDSVNGAKMSRGKKRALKTVSVPQEEHLQTVVSSADGAKVRIPYTTNK